MNDLHTSPFDALLALSSDVKSTNESPIVVDAEQWVGVAFSLGGRDYLADMVQVGEVLTPPPMTMIPGVKPWVLGVANVRGRLAPVVDLAGFFDLAKPDDLRRQRVIIVELGDSYIGILVDIVYGMRHFSRSSFSDITSEIETATDPLARFVNGTYEDASQTWELVDLFQLLFSDNFQNVAA